MQQMHPEEQRHYQGYEGNQSYEQPHAGEPYGPSAMYDDEFMDAFAQRLSQRMAQGPAGKIQPPNRHGASSGQRLALAIVSISLLAFITLILFTNSSISSLVALAVLGGMTVAFIIINGIFNAMK
ncbi:hypothetical protein KSF_023040 [Reticulibacter mediterranei]|uniref:Uncharacterized protein n=1 Tax=Reticulibacter mediterranei TaxID=2778369 RepID=A0A8J3IMQ0_9CHLR|nr:hypothetical protein [Reticulibacter mediterranei]GHO92256.1 hypothetical protein KSF_023040 [Reticulibacter mediterranei]